MIAVFCAPQILKNLELLLSKQFKIIKSESTLIGTKFTGIVFLGGWKKDNKLIEACKMLKYRQPELFSKHPYH